MNKPGGDDPRAQALRANTGKPHLTMVPPSLQEAVARVLEFGANKYARDNWRKGFPHTSVVDCMLRHINAWLEGEDNDAESGLPHMAHVACNVAFLIEFQKKGLGVDDRYVPPTPEGDDGNSLPIDWNNVRFRAKEVVQ